MPKVSPLQNNFNGGEFSPMIYGRVDSDRYNTGLAICLNYIPTIQGGLVRRPGTYFVAEVKTSTKATRVVRFEFSITQAYILEFGDQYLRFYMDNGQIQSGGSPYEISTPYLEADIFDLGFTQSADILYIVHPDYAPRKLSRTGHTSWTLTTISFLDGPYLGTNRGTTTLTPSAATGTGVTLTASAVTGINNNTGFQTTDVGRSIRIQEGSTWGWVIIATRVSTTVVTVNIQKTLTNTTAKTNWRMGLWSDTTGYPSCATFHEDRLMFAGTLNYPQRLDGSRTGDYENFEPTDSDGTVVASHAIGFTLNSDTVNAIRWLVSSEKGLMAGTYASEWVIRASTSGEGLSPTNINASSSTNYGSADVQAVMANKSIIFVQRSGEKFRELRFFFEQDGFEAPDLTMIAEHIARGGIIEIARQVEPQSIVWAVRADGTLLGMTYERDVEVVRVGWHRHILGGVGDVNGNPPVVESVAVIPSADGSRDEVWLVVKRYINGATVRYIEYMTPLFTDNMDQEDAFFVDCGLTYDSTPTTSVSGADHLEGESVSILADGAVRPNETVSSGSFTLDTSASVIQAGYSYNSDGQILRIEAGSTDGTAIGKYRRISRVSMMLYRTLGLKIGMSFDSLDTVTFRSTTDASGEPPSLFSGILSETVEADYDYDNQFCWRQDQPLPGTILAIAPRLVTQDD